MRNQVEKPRFLKMGGHLIHITFQPHTKGIVGIVVQPPYFRTIKGLNLMACLQKL